MQSIPRKNDIIINPKTNRPIRVGSHVWKQLAKDGLVNNHYEDPKILYNLEIPKENIDQKITELNDRLPYTQQAVRGRGKYANKIVSRQKQPNIELIAKSSAKKSAKLIKEKANELEEYDEQEIESEIERMLMKEFIIPRSKPMGIVKKQQIKFKQPTKFSVHCDESTTECESTELDSDDE